MEFDYKWLELLTFGLYEAVVLETMIKHKLQLHNVTTPSWGNSKHAHTILFVPAASSNWFSIFFSHSVPPQQERILPYINHRIFFEKQYRT